MAAPHSQFTTEIGDEICRKIAEGSNLKDVAEDLGFTRAVIWKWRDRNPEFKDKYDQAQIYNAHAHFDEIIAIADGMSENDSLQQIRRDQLKVDARKWVIARKVPSVYGERVTHTGDATNPIEHKHALDAEQFTKMLASMAARNTAEST